MKLLIDQQDRFGYYQVGDIKIYNKVEAIRLHSRTGIHPEWKFNDEVFGSYDWTKEPTDSLESLYRKRAEQLREKYDYIVLLYSGGADSHNVLDTFINNSIHLDEICTFHYLKGNTATCSRNQEIIKMAVPYAQQILQQHPEIKHRIVDLTDYMHDFFSVGENAELGIFEQTSTQNPSMIVRRRIHELVPEYRSAIADGKRICFIWGCEKPRVIQKDGKYRFRFIDIIDAAANPGSTSPIELFYWTPDLPELMIKQAHIIKRYLQHSNETTPYMTTSPTKLIYKEHQGGKLWMTTDGCHALIYPTWRPDFFSAGKSPSPIFAPAAKWFFTLQNDQASRNYFDLLSQWWRELPDYWKNDPSDWSKGGVGCWSRDYFLD